MTYKLFVALAVAAVTALPASAQTEQQAAEREQQHRQEQRYRQPAETPRMREARERREFELSIRRERERTRAAGNYWRDSQWMQEQEQERAAELRVTEPRVTRREVRDQYSDSYSRPYRTTPRYYDSVDYPDRTRDGFRNPYEDYRLRDTNRFNNDSDRLTRDDLEYKSRYRRVDLGGGELYDEREQRWDNETSQVSPRPQGNRYNSR